MSNGLVLENSVLGAKLVKKESRILAFVREVDKYKRREVML